MPFDAAQDTPTESTIRCIGCKEAKPPTCFHWRRFGVSRDSRCKVCKRINNRRLDRAKPERKKTVAKDYRLRLRLAVLSHYGGCCACCGEAEPAFLVIDHINGGGNIHRRELGNAGRGSAFYQWLRNQNYPSGYRVLCQNCNSAMGLYGKCPHQDRKQALVCTAA